ncbi:MAG: F0F1 ATP synthase subunit delta [Lentisphaeria bacterium]|nr:F0F1 ATP synthase subunit delta [Lentisphaeria bacterium]
MNSSIIITTIVVQFATFGVLALVLHRFMYSAYKSELGRLQDLSLEYKNKAEQLAEDMGKAEAEHRRKVEEAEAEIRELRNSVQEEVGQQREEVLVKARAESERIIATAITVKDKIRQELEKDYAGKSVNFACDLIRRVLNEENMKWFHDGLVSDVLAAIERVPSERFQAVTGEKMVMVTSAQPLAEAKEIRLAQVLKNKVGHDMTINSFTDEDVTAGVSIKIGSLVIDGTLAGQLRQAAAKIKRG